MSAEMRRFGVPAASKFMEQAAMENRRLGPMPTNGRDGQGMDEEQEPETKFVAIDGTDSLAGLIIRRHDEDSRMLTVEAWAAGLSKRAAAHVLRQIAASWDKDADEEAEALGLN